MRARKSHFAGIWSGNAPSSLFAIIVVIPERRSLIRDRNKLSAPIFLRSRLALRLAGMTKRQETA